MIYFFSNLEVDFQYWYIYFETQKYTWSILSKLMYLSSNSEVYLNHTFNIDVFILKLWNILEIDVVHLCNYVQNQKFIWSRFPKQCISFQTQTYTWSMLHLKNIKKYKWSIIEVQTKYLLIFFCLYTSFILLFRKFT